MIRVLTMKKIDIATIRDGMIAASDLFAENGHLLVPKGAKISSHHICYFFKRNIFEVYAEIDPREEIELLIEGELLELEKLDFVQNPVRFELSPEVAARPAVREEIVRKEIKIDFEHHKSTPNPSGPPIQHASELIERAERTQLYKKRLHGLHTAHLTQVSRVLDRLAQGRPIAVEEIVPVVQNCTAILVTDRSMLLALARMPCRDEDYVYAHALHTCILAIVIAAKMGYSDRQVIEIGLCGLLQDVGMLLIDRKFRIGSDALTAADWFELKKHPIVGELLLKNVTLLPETVRHVALQTHERLDGSGYPAGRKAAVLHPFSMIVQIADTYDALCNQRGDRQAFTPSEAMQSVLKMTRRGMLSKAHAIAFVSSVGFYPIGTFVELSDHRIARVVHSHQREFDKPTVSILTDTQQKLLEEGDIIQLDLSYFNCSVRVLRDIPASALGVVGTFCGF